MKEVTDKMVRAVKEFLGKEGVEFFKDVVEAHGRVDAVYAIPLESGRNLPHAVHFNEGMQVRNCLRRSDLCDGWTDEDYDSLWVEAVEKALA